MPSFPSKYDVLPLDDRRYERANADLAGRPQLVKGNSQLLFRGMGRLSENFPIEEEANESHETRTWVRLLVSSTLTVVGVAFVLAQDYTRESGPQFLSYEELVRLGSPISRLRGT